mmetsp:Transcript_595/g.1453  ORF Transcript_595/g.1453 Transcript_595/m.1453 type:complete len:200 (-) Transcript_595:371-970(-)
MWPGGARKIAAPYRDRPQVDGPLLLPPLIGLCRERKHDCRGARGESVAEEALPNGWMELVYPLYAALRAGVVGRNGSATHRSLDAARMQGVVAQLAHDETRPGNLVGHPADASQLLRLRRRTVVPTRGRRRRWGRRHARRRGRYAVHLGLRPLRGGWRQADSSPLGRVRPVADLVHQLFLIRLATKDLAVYAARTSRQR